MPDVLSGDGSGLESPGSGALLYPMSGGGSVTNILPASTHSVNACNKFDGTTTLPIFGADMLIVQTYGLVAAYPTCTLTVQYSADGVAWISSGVTITTATTTRLDSTSGTPTGYAFARVIVTTAASGSEQIINITVTALKTGT